MRNFYFKSVEFAKYKAKLNSYTNWVNCLIQLRNGNIVSGSVDISLKIWNIESGTCLETLNGHINRVRCVVELRNSNIISGSDYKSLKIKKKLIHHHHHHLTVIMNMFIIKT